jgi:hypothetical protein
VLGGQEQKIMANRRSAKKKAAAKGAAAGVKSSKMTDAKDFITKRRYFDARFVGSVNNYCCRTASATKRL